MPDFIKSVEILSEALAASKCDGPMANAIKSGFIYGSLEVYEEREKDKLTAKLYEHKQRVLTKLGLN